MSTCKFCQMKNQIPETPCSHCGRMLPAPEPCYISKDEDDAENSEAGAATETGSESGEGGAESGEGGDDQGSGSESAEAGDGSAAEAGAADSEAAGEGGESGDSESDQESEVAPQHGHVDNVGDESESETVT